MNPLDRWRETWTECEAEPQPGLIEELIQAYGEAHRAYHTVHHLAECFAHLDGCPFEPDAPACVELALWFHDAVYDPRSAVNEALSAEWAGSALAILGRDMVERVCGLILVTKHNEAPTDHDQELLLDIDLSILGAPADRFDEYESEIRMEYTWVPEDTYRAARAKVLSMFQSRPAIYNTGYFRALLEAKARNNLLRSLGTLAGQ